MDKGTVTQNRHDLLTLDDDGRVCAYNEARLNNTGVPDELLFEMIVTKKVPAIVRRQAEAPDGFINVGYSSWLHAGGRRVRAQSIVATRFIERTTTPYQVAGLLFADNANEWRQTSQYETAITVAQLADRSGIDIGLFGSVALAVATSLPYIDESSDLDLVIKADRYEDVIIFHDKLIREQPAFRCKLDIELDIGDGFHVKLMELFSSQTTIMAKGLWDVRLMSKQAVQNACQRPPLPIKS